MEEECKKQMNIPVFHDDQHGTAIICLAGIINVMRMKNMKIQDAKIVMVGAGAAGIACMAMVKKYGADPSKVVFLPLEPRKARRLERLLCFARNHSIVTRGSVSLSCATISHLPAFLNLNGIFSVYRNFKT